VRPGLRPVPATLCTTLRPKTAAGDRPRPAGRETTLASCLRLQPPAGVDNQTLGRRSDIAKGIAGDEGQFGIGGRAQDPDISGTYDLGGIYHVTELAEGRGHNDIIASLHFFQGAKNCIAMGGEGGVAADSRQSSTADMSHRNQKDFGMAVVPSRTMAEISSRGISIRPITPPWCGGRITTVCGTDVGPAERSFTVTRLAFRWTRNMSNRKYPYAKSAHASPVTRAHPKTSRSRFAHSATPD